MRSGRPRAVRCHDGRKEGYQCLAAGHEECSNGVVVQPGVQPRGGPSGCPLGWEASGRCERQGTREPGARNGCYRPGCSRVRPRAAVAGDDGAAGGEAWANSGLRPRAGWSAARWHGLVLQLQLDISIDGSGFDGIRGLSLGTEQGWAWWTAQGDAAHEGEEVDVRGLKKEEVGGEVEFGFVSSLDVAAAVRDWERKQESAREEFGMALASQ